MCPLILENIWLEVISRIKMEIVSFRILRIRKENVDIYQRN